MLAVALALSLAGCERVVQEVDADYRGMARLNPYLATERLFTRLGVPARTSQAVGKGVELVPGEAILWLAQEPLSNEDAERLLRWTEEGGHLIYVIPPPEAGADALVSRLQVSLRPPRYPVAKRMGEDVADLALPPGEERARVAIRRQTRLFAETGPWMIFTHAGTEDGAFLMTFDREPGRITLVADGSFLRNENIGRHQHARLAWHLVDWRQRPSKVTILFHRGALPRLARLAARHAWPVLLAGCLLLAAALWRAGARFGPVAPDPPPGSRALLEHVEAAGELLWRHGRAGDLVAATRQALLRRIERRQPGWARLPRRELALRLAGAAKISPQRAAEALEGGVATDPTDVLTTIQTLETLRRSL